MKNYPKTNKNLGQHYLIDQNIIQTITKKFNDNIQNIIEVGPGPGILTKFLIKHNLPFCVIEKDKRFKENLNDILEPQNIIFDDALEFDFNFFQKKIYGLLATFLTM